MIQQNTYRLRTVICTLFVVLAVLLASLVSFIQMVVPTATAAPSTYLNFQARLRTSTGSLVPDGNYNIEFKIYDANSSSGSSQGSCSGDANCLWTETRTGANVVRVANGYFTVSLGSVTAFPSTIDWSEQKWITMNIGGTGSPSWDGEMTNGGNRMILTAVPYAFKADKANTALNVASDATNTASTNSAGVSIQSGNATGSTSNSGNLTIDAGTATGTAGQILLGNTNTSGLLIGRAGVTTTLQGSVSLSGTGTALNVTNNASVGGSLTVGATGGVALAVTGLPINSSTSSLVRIGGAISGGHSGANGGTYLGINSPASGAGSTADFVVFQSNGTRRFRVTNAGNITASVLGDNAETGPFLSLNSANVTLVTRSASNLGMVVQGSASQTGDLMAFNNNGGTRLSGVNATGNFYMSNSTYNNVLQSATLTDNRAITLPDATGTVCLQGSSACGFIAGSLTDNAADALDIQEGTNNYININTTNSSENISFGNATTNPTYNFLGSGTLSVAGAATFSGTLTVGNVLSATNITIGTSDTTGTLLVLDTKTNAGDPAGTNGGMYYNSNLGKFRCYEGGAWKDCVGLSSSLTDNTANAWDIQEGTNNYININTTNGSEDISFGNATTNPTYNFLGSGGLAVQGGVATLGTTSQAGSLVLSDGSSNTAAIQVDSLGGNYTITIPTITANDILCLQGLNNCSGLSAALADNTANAWDIQEGTNNYININTTNSSENISFGNATTNPTYSFLGSGTLSVAGPATFSSTITVGNVLSATNITIGTTDTTATLLVLDTKTDSGDPTGVNGAMYYNSNLGKFRCYQNSSWVDCISAGATGLVDIVLSPEYAGATLTPDGTDNLGTLTSDFCSGTSRLTLTTSLCAATEEYNYYSWTSSETSGQQDYDIWVRYQLPADFSNFDDDSSLQFIGRRENSNDNVTVTTYRSVGTSTTACGSATGLSTTAAWETVTITGSETGCGFGGGDILLFKVTVSAASSRFVRVSDLSFTYTR